MTRPTRIAAADWLWDDTAHIHGCGTQCQTETQRRLSEAIGRLVTMPGVPIRVIEEVAEIIRAAYEAGKERR